MNKVIALDRMNDILKDVLDRDDVQITEESLAEDYEEWDSLAHINIVTQIEADFDISFTLDEIEEFYSVKNILHAVLKKV